MLPIAEALSSAHHRSVVMASLSSTRSDCSLSVRSFPDRAGGFPSLNGRIPAPRFPIAVLRPLLTSRHLAATRFACFRDCSIWQAMSAALPFPRQLHVAPPHCRRIYLHGHTSSPSVCCATSTRRVGLLCGSCPSARGFDSLRSPSGQPDGCLCPLRSHSPSLPSPSRSPFPSWLQMVVSSFSCSGISTGDLNPVYNVPMLGTHKPEMATPRKPSDQISASHRRPFL